MGWQIDKRLIVDGTERHFGEGWVQGLLITSGHGSYKYRDITSTEEEVKPDAVQAVCECGWRSRRFDTRFINGVRYMPSITLVPDELEGRLVDLWMLHVCGGSK